MLEKKGGTKLHFQIANGGKVAHFVRRIWRESNPCRPPPRYYATHATSICSLCGMYFGLFGTWVAPGRSCVFSRLAQPCYWRAACNLKTLFDFFLSQPDGFWHFHHLTIIRSKARGAERLAACGAWNVPVVMFKYLLQTARLSHGMDAAASAHLHVSVALYPFFAMHFMKSSADANTVTAHRRRSRHKM